MIKQFIHHIPVFILLLSGFCFNTAVAQGTQVFGKLDQANIRIGDQTNLRLTVEQPVKEQVVFPKLADTLSEKIQILSSSKADTIRDQKNPDRITVTKTYVITCFDAGTYAVPPMVFASQSGELKTNGLTLDVQAVKVDTTKAIYDIKQPLAVSYSFMDWLRDNWQLVVFPLAAIVLVIVLIYYWRKKQRSKPVPAVLVPALPIHTIAMNKLNELRDKKLWQRDEVKQYYSELSDVMREYLEKRYSIKTQEKTTDEIFDSLRYVEIAAEPKVILHQLLVISDLVKFAKEKPRSAENEKSMEDAVSFVLGTQVKPEPAQPSAAADLKNKIADLNDDPENKDQAEKKNADEEKYKPKGNIEGGRDSEHA